MEASSTLARTDFFSQGMYLCALGLALRGSNANLASPDSVTVTLWLEGGILAVQKRGRSRLKKRPLASAVNTLLPVGNILSANKAATQNGEFTNHLEHERNVDLYYLDQDRQSLAIKYAVTGSNPSLLRMRSLLLWSWGRKTILQRLH